jgi:hypothetical protein
MRLLAKAACADVGTACTDGCVWAAGASLRARRLVHRQPHSKTWRFRRGQLIAVAIGGVGAASGRHDEHLGGACGLGGVDLQEVAGGDGDAGRAVTEVQDARLGIEPR